MTIVDDNTRSTISRSGDRELASHPPQAEVRAVYPRDVEASLVLAGEPVVIGRRPDDAGRLIVNHATASRRHLKVEWDPIWRTHLVTDLGSYNGTRIAGRAVAADERVALDDGAVVQLGDVILVYERCVEVTAADSEAVSLDAVPGCAARVRALRGAMERAASDPAPVLLMGETGAGKEQVAQELHRLSGRSGDLIPVNCAALSPELIESQLFGHLRGSFTGATADQQGFFRAADRGTLFLDEIGELPTELQAKLLRAIQEGEVQPVGSTATVPVDVRIIAATNRELVSDIDDGTFRRDLYARLALWELSVAPLRQRRPDILTWLDTLFEAWKSERGDRSDRKLALSAEAAEAIVLNPWPDNLRGLNRLLHSLEVGGPGEGSIRREHLPSWLVSKDDSQDGEPRGRLSRRKSPTREEFTRVFRELGDNVSATARHFQRDRKQIYRWIEAYGLRESDE